MKFTKQTQTLIRVLKCREIGETGPADVLEYDRTKGRNILASPFEQQSSFDPHTDKDEDIPF